MGANFIIALLLQFIYEMEWSVSVEQGQDFLQVMRLTDEVCILGTKIVQGVQRGRNIDGCPFQPAVSLCL